MYVLLTKSQNIDNLFIELVVISFDLLKRMGKS